jgi:aquaporin Z
MKLLALAAEFTGAFALLTAILFTGNWLAIGLTLAGVILIVGETSGGHINPAVSFAMYLKGTISVTELVSYSVAQCAGAASALAVFKAIA